jgi:LuxR family transcriptional regulator, maltose regulon positive regulatory protein
MIIETLLSTKLQIPAARPNLVARARLVAQLAEGVRLGRRLSLVSAPPGFGKTTLLREWVGAAERRVAWLTLDEGDNDATRWVRYVIAALSQADERLGRAPLATDSPSQEMLVALINDLAAAGTELLLVLDDYHLIRAFAVHDLVAFLLENQPANLHVAIGTREDPPLPLPRLRARDQVTEVRERALRFTPAEAAAFLNQTMSLGLAPEAITALAARTEGWITGLQLAGLALRQESTAEFLTSFAGDDRYVADYLMAEVLERTPEPLRDFMRQTSILERLSAPLCAAVTGRDDAQAMLEHLETANLFLVPLDNHREWYRYHALFAEVLRLTLGVPEQVVLHQKAAAWYDAHGWSEPALYHTRRVTELTPKPGATGQRAAKQPLVEPLSEREIEVLQLIAEGYANAEIAHKLYITTGTVKRHINNIYGKLGVGSRTQAVAKARALGFVT